MNAGVWALLALALVLAPAPSAVPLRMTSLAASARLASPVQSARPQRRRSLRSWAGAFAGAVSALFISLICVRAGPLMGIAAIAAGVAVWHLARTALSRRRGARRAACLVAAVHLLVADLRAGSAQAAAFDAASESVSTEDSDALRGAARLIESGQSAAPALAGDPVLRPLALAWDVAENSGAAPADVLARVADDLAASLAQRRAVHLALAGPRSSAVLIAGLPVLGMWLGAAMGAAPISFLLGAPVGRLVCAVGVGLDVLGALWTQRLLDRAASS